jgi:iron complex transport system substrate-binding protein
MKTLMFAIAVSLVSLGLFAQGSKEQSSSQLKSTASSVETSSQFPKTVQHAWGSTTLDEEPQRIVTLGWSNEDVFLALGITPVGTAMANWGAVDEHGLLPWTYSAYVANGEDDPLVFDDVDGTDFESVSDATPDAIVATYSGMTEDEYKLLSQIAPTIPYLTIAWNSRWRDNVRQIADIMGMQEKGEQLISESEADIAEANAHYPDLKGKKAVLLWINPADLSTYYTYGPNDPRGAYLLDLGFSYPEELKKYFIEESTFSTILSADNIEELDDLDIMIIYGDDKSIAALEADPLFSQVPAVKNHHVVALENGTELTAAINPTVLSIPATVDDVLAKIDSVFN